MRKVLETLKSKNCILRATINASNFQQKSLKIGEEQLHHLKTLNPSCSLLDLFPYTESCFISLPLTHSILNLLQLKLTHIQCEEIGLFLKGVGDKKIPTQVAQLFGGFLAAIFKHVTF